MMSRLGDRIALLGMGEPLHGGEEFLILRNRLYRRLAEAHGFSAVTFETNYSRARLVDAYVSGRDLMSPIHRCLRSALPR
jgi:erythromycin esterase-like protein